METTTVFLRSILAIRAIQRKYPSKLEPFFSCKPFGAGSQSLFRPKARAEQSEINCPKMVWDARHPKTTQKRLGRPTTIPKQHRHGLEENLQKWLGSAPKAKQPKWSRPPKTTQKWFGMIKLAPETVESPNPAQKHFERAPKPAQQELLAEPQSPEMVWRAPKRQAPRHVPSNCPLQSQPRNGMGPRHQTGFGPVKTKNFQSKLRFKFRSTLSDQPRNGLGEFQNQPANRSRAPRSGLGKLQNQPRHEMESQGTKRALDKLKPKTLGQKCEFKAFHRTQTRDDSHGLGFRV